MNQGDRSSIVYCCWFFLIRFCLLKRTRQFITFKSFYSFERHTYFGIQLKTGKQHFKQYFSLEWRTIICQRCPIKKIPHCLIFLFVCLIARKQDENQSRLVNRLPVYTARLVNHPADTTDRLLSFQKRNPRF